MRSTKSTETVPLTPVEILRPLPGLSTSFGVFARRLYGRFLKRSFVGRELVTVKFNAKLFSDVHFRVINNENTCFEFFSIAKCSDSCSPKTGTRLKWSRKKGLPFRRI